ncbi:hypothetical protein [Thalassotalea litorea]|uniref:hypothetical protein n=1 Tax=Thalassotalea litorea TaxID=2020715 RepID=UPI003736EA8C
MYQNIEQQFEIFLGQKFDYINELTDLQKTNLARLILGSTIIIYKDMNPISMHPGYSKRRLSKLFGPNKFDEIISRLTPAIIEPVLSDNPRLKYQITEAGKKLAFQFSAEKIFD